MHGQSSKQLRLLALVGFLDMFAYAMLSPVVSLLFLQGPHSILMDSANYRHFLLGVFLSLFSFVQIFSVPLWGRFSLRLGKKKILQISFMGNILAYSLGAWGVYNKSLSLLFLSAILAGLTGAIVPTLHTMLSEVVDKKDWSRSFSLMGGVVSLAFITGPQFTRLLMEFFSASFLVPWVYAICALLSLFNYVFVVFAIKHQEKPQQEKQEPAKSFLSHYGHWGQDLKRILVFQFCIYMGWYIFIKFFHVYLLESLQCDEKQACLGLSYLGLCCAVWQGLRFLKDPAIFQHPAIFSAAVFLMSFAVIAFMFIESFTAMLVVVPLLALTYALITPSALSLLLSKGSLEPEMKTAIFQSVQAIAKILAPLLSGFSLSFTNQPPALLGFIVISIAAGLVLLCPSSFASSELSHRPSA